MATKKLVSLRSEAEIKEKIAELIKDADNFTSDNYGSKAHILDGNFETYYSEFCTEKTLNNFVMWLFDKKVD